MNIFAYIFRKDMWLSDSYVLTIAQMSPGQRSVSVYETPLLFLANHCYSALRWSFPLDRLLHPSLCITGVILCSRHMCLSHQIPGLYPRLAGSLDSHNPL